MSGGTKYDSGKARLDLISPIALQEISKVMAFGANKYGAWNWRKGIHYSRLLAAMLRHIFAFSAGESKDPETGISHIAHAAANCMFLLEFEVTNPSLDDRYKPSSDTSMTQPSDQVLPNFQVQTAKQKVAG